MHSQLGAISPLDGRYQNSVKELNAYFSEAALMRYRIYVEIEYLIALSLEKDQRPSTLKRQTTKAIKVDLSEF